MVYVIMSITIMLVILMVVIAAIWIHGLEMIDAMSTIIILKCAIMTKGIVVTAIELLTGSVMTQTITEFVIMMEETAASD